MIFNTRASSGEEAEMLVAHPVSDLVAKGSPIFYEDDSYGAEGREAVLEGLKRRGFPFVGVGAYVRNSVRVEDALFQITKTKPNAVVLFGIYSAEILIPVSSTRYLNVSKYGPVPLPAAREAMKETQSCSPASCEFVNLPPNRLLTRSSSFAGSTGFAR